MPVNGRTTADLVESIKAKIGAGDIPAGNYLPAQRDLAEVHGVARNTVRRALKTLESDGFIAAEARRGYRVLSRAHDPELGCPVAFAVSRESIVGGWDHFHRALAQLVKASAAERGWEFIQVVDDRESLPAVLAQLSGTLAWGVIVDSAYPEVLSAAASIGMATLSIDSWDDAANCDGVVQDGFGGGFRAANYLVRKGHSRIAWFGPQTRSFHGRSRFGGASAALGEEGLDFQAVCQELLGSPGLAARARELLSGKDRPTAVLALWVPMARAIAEAADELGLKLGKDLEMVSWCAEEIYSEAFLPLFTEGKPSATVVWSAATMADAAMNRLAERRLKPEMPAMRLTVPTSLRETHAR
jgi:DNA-binding LacI/PurR family transcriptional regulator